MELKCDVFQIRLLWDDPNANMDYSALLLTKDKKILSEDYFIFFNSKCRLSQDCSHLLSRPVARKDWWDSHPCDPEMSIIGSCDCSDDNLEDDVEECDYEWFKVDLNRNRIRKEINEVVFVVSIYDDRYYPQGRMRVQMIENGIVFFDVEYKTCRAVETIKLTRINNDWIVESLGIEHSKGLADIVELYC